MGWILTINSTKSSATARLPLHHPHGRVRTGDPGVLQIIIQGRGGQGAQTAGNLLAMAFSAQGRQLQCFASYGGARPQRDFPWLAQAYLDGKLKLDELISMRLPLDRINDVLDELRKGRIGGRVVIDLAQG